MIDDILLKFNQIVPNKWQWVLDHQGFRKYFKNTGWMFLSRVVGMAVSFFIGVQVARYLGPSQYGLLNYASGFTGLFLYFVTFGTDSILNRDLVAYPDKRDVYLGTGFVLRLVGAFLAILLIIISLIFMNAGLLINALILISAFTFIFQAFVVIDFYFQSQVLSKNTVKIQVTVMLISSIIKLLFIYFSVDLIWFACIAIIDAVMTTIGFVVAYTKTGLNIFNWRFERLIALNLLKNSWPLIFSGIAVAVYYRIDQIIIQNIIGSSSVGIYSAAVKLAEIWYIIPVVVCASLFPAIINAKKTNLDLYKKRLSNLYLFMFWLSIIISLPISIFSSSIISILFGPSFGGASDVLRIYVLSCIPLFLWMAINQYLILENYIKTNLYQSIIVAISNTCLNLILIPRSGIVGAAYATLISYFVGLLFYAYSKKSRNQFFIAMRSIFFIKNT